MPETRPMLTHSSFPLNAALEEISKAVRMKIAIKISKGSGLKKSVTNGKVLYH